LKGGKKWDKEGRSISEGDKEENKKETDIWKQTLPQQA